MRFVLALTSYGNYKEALKASKEIVKKKLGACVNILKVNSVYGWKGKLENNPECMLLIKTEKSKAKELGEFIMKNHPFELPEFIVIPISTGSKLYLDWIRKSLE